MGDSYHVVGSERDIFTTRGHLAGSGMLLVPAIEAGPRRGPGPIRAPSSRDDSSLRDSPLPHATGPIKVGAGPFTRSLPCLASRSSGCLTPPTVGITSTLPSVIIAGLLLLFSAHMTLTPPTHLVPPPTLYTRSGLHPPSSNPSFTPTVSTRAARSKRRRASCQGVTIRCIIWGFHEQRLNLL